MRRGFGLSSNASGHVVITEVVDLQREPERLFVDTFPDPVCQCDEASKHGQGMMCFRCTKGDLISRYSHSTGDL